MSLFVPAALRKSVADFGAEGSEWLDRLPARVAELEDVWSLTAGRAFDTDGCVSWVAPAQLADGSAAVLKVGIPHSEARYEAEALRFFDGRDAARLLRASEDGFSLLLERCVPGENLWSLDEAEGNAVGARVLQRLWREPPASAPFDRLSDIAADWCASLPSKGPTMGYDAGMVAQAVEMARHLAATQPQAVLLHGDFHPGNVLSAAREPWLVIDPKPLIGEPAYDLAQWLSNRCRAAEQSPDPVAAIRWQIDQLAGLLALDPARIAGWAFVKSLGWDCGPSTAVLLHAASNS